MNVPTNIGKSESNFGPEVVHVSGDKGKVTVCHFIEHHPKRPHVNGVAVLP